MKHCLQRLFQAKLIVIFLFLFNAQANAQCAYYVTDFNPWGQTHNQTAMNMAFGVGNWTQGTFSTPAATIFAPGTCYVMLEGADANAIELQTFLTNNQALVENWVAAGGRLFINSAPNEGSNMNWYFGGVGLNTSGGGSPGTAVNPSHPIFLGPNLPTVTTWTGGGFTHGQVTGTGLTDVIYVAGTQKAFCYKAWGSGVVFFGSMTQPNYWSPNPQATNIWRNIFAYTAVQPGGALHFDATAPNDYVDLQTQVTDLSGGDFTMELWVKSTGTNVALISVENGNGFWEGGEKQFYLDAAGRPVFEAFNAGYIFGTQSVNNGAWHHVAVTFGLATQTRRMYVDGVNVTDMGSSWFTGGWGMTGTFRLGRAPAVPAFTGSMDEVRIWNRELCQGEIQAHMSCELPAGQTGLMGYYKFNQGTVGSANPGINTLTDASGNNFTGILNNFALTGTTSNWVAGNVTGTCAAFTFTPTITATGSTTLCPGGSVTLTSTAATSYQWKVGGVDILGATSQSYVANAAGNYTVATLGCAGTSAITSVVNNPAIVITPTQTNETPCINSDNGTATATVTGGTPGYAYNWTPGNPTGDGTNSVSNLTAGPWTVTVTDGNNCTANQSYTITEPTLVTGSTTQTNVSCFGGNNGTATATGAGGNGPYTYLWSNGQTTATATGLTAGTYTVTIYDAGLCTATASVTITQPTVLSASTTQVNVSCNGGTNGSATVTPAGGTTPYTYLWSNGQTTATATGLAAGTYSVLVTDNLGCTTTPTVTITQPAVLAATTTQVNVSCFGGSNGTATVIPTGGTIPYTYLWSNGQTTATATGLSIGTYSVVVTDNLGCTTNQSVTITQPTVLAMTASSSTNVSCFGGSNGTATIAVTGGTTPYTYLWSNGQTTATATGLAIGTYSVVVTDALGCTISQSYTITQPGLLVATPGTQTNVLCNGGNNGAANITVTGGTGVYNYNWTPGNPVGDNTNSVSGLTAGTWSVTVTDQNGCIASTTMTITQPPALVVTPVSQTNISCNGGSNGAASVTATGGTGTLSYNWAPGNPAGDGTNSVTGLVAGTYTVTVTDLNNCSATQIFTITQPPVLTLSNPLQTNVSCNGGNNGTATITAAGGTGTLSYNWTPGNPAGDGTNSVTGLTAGTWTVTVTDINGCSAAQTFTIIQNNALVATAVSQTNISCFGGNNGSATVGVTGGTGAGTYSYSWAPAGGNNSIAGNLTAGTYTVTVTDANNCSTTQTFTITQPAVLASTQAHTNVSCNNGANGTATVIPTGGTLPYTYSWTPAVGNTATVSNLVAGTYNVIVTDANSCTTTQSIVVTQPTTLVASAVSQVNVLCAGANTGAATVGVTGGTMPYTYNWLNIGLTTPTVTGLIAGTYAVTVTDALGCLATQVFTITQPTPMDLSGTQTNVACNGGTNGSATVTPSGGAAPYTFSWAPSGGNAATATGLSAGTYTVTVTDGNGCVATHPFNIVQATTLAVAPTSQTNVGCFGGNTGSAAVTATGGTFPYTYSWAPTGGSANNAPNLTVGTYTVTVTDANLCSATQTFTITQPTQLVATTSQSNVSCNAGTNGSATITATGGTGAYTYSWFPTGGNAATASGLAAGTYVVTLMDANNCSITHTFTITQPTTLVASSAGQTNVGCNGGNNGTATVAATGGTAPYTYLWPNGQTTATATGLAAGTYTATVTDANMCTASQVFTITQPVSLAYTPTQTNVSCNGNSNGSATITMTGGVAPYIYSWSPSGGTAATASNLLAGTYTVSVTDANNCTVTASYTITEPQLLSVTTGSNSPVCSGASISLTSSITGGTAPFTTEWTGPAGYTSNQGSPTIINATTANGGTYNVTVTDANNCSVSTTQSVTVDQTPLITIQPTATTACIGSSAGFVVTAIGTGITYQWRANGTNISNNATYSGATTNALSINDVTGLNGTQYDVVITGICGNVTSASVMLTNATTNTWTGTVSTAWSDGANWQCGNVPTLDLDVVIPSTAPNMPLVDIPSAKAKSITIDAGGSLGFIGTANKLEVRANISNQGSFDASNGAIMLSGTGSQSIPGGSYRELEIAGANNKTLQADATVTQSLKLTAGYLRLGDRNLTLAEPSVITGGSAASFVITDSMGALIRVNLGTGANEQAEIFPVGQQAGIYTPATITNAGDMDNFSVRVIDGVYASYNNDEPVGVAHTDNVVNKTWVISELVDGGSNATIALSWPSGEELPNFSNANCNVSHFDQGSWTDGPFSAATSNAGLFTQSVTGIATFSPFAVGTAAVPLVVEEIKHLVYGLVVFPNPVVDNKVFVRLSNNAIATDMDITVVDMLGRVVAQQKYKAGTYNYQAIEVNIGDVAAGTYTLKLKQDGAVLQTAKFIRK